MEPAVKKPNLSSRPQKKVHKPEAVLLQLQRYYRYRIGSMYRQIRLPIFQNLLSNQKSHKSAQNKSVSIASEQSIEKWIQLLHKQVTLNSKYHHREKMRFSRMPLIKYIKYDMMALNNKLKSKQYIKVYDDLEDSDEDKEDKKEYFSDPHFSQDALQKYKRKNGIKGRVVIAHGYGDLKQRLVSEYGWTQNNDNASLMYDFKFMSKKKDLDYVNLLDKQVINHFDQNKNITAKFGLCRNIRNIVMLGKDPSQFFPRCFDVNDVCQFENFYEDFKTTQAQAIVKEYVERKGRIPSSVGVQLGEKAIQTCLNILYKQFLPINEQLQCIKKQNSLFISLKQWEILTLYQKKKALDKQAEDMEETSINQGLFHKAVRICEIGAEKDPQWHLNYTNTWIIKPASMSRGRGIKTFNDLNEILDYVIGKQISWVAQKYIERPLILFKRKFDLRQWVLLTDFKPLRVWVYEECYVRFCAELYTPQNLKNRRIHLTNNSVTKGQTLIQDGIEQNMMSEKDFSAILMEREGKDIFQELIRPQINKIAVQSLQSVKQNIANRKNTLQILGYDYMIDENYKVWLIEVNSSPTMEYSTKVTTRIVQKGMSDLADLVQNYMFGNKYYRHDKAKQLYGGWKLLTNR